MRGLSGAQVRSCHSNKHNLGGPRQLPQQGPGSAGSAGTASLPAGQGEKLPEAPLCSGSGAKASPAAMSGLSGVGQCNSLTGRGGGHFGKIMQPNIKSKARNISEEAGEQLQLCRAIAHLKASMRKSKGILSYIIIE